MSNPAGPAVKLKESNLEHLDSRVGVFTYPRRRVTQSIVHIGVGGFFRAHQAVYLDDLLEDSANLGWGLCGVGLLAQDSRMRDALLPQDCLYTVVECSATGRQARVIGSLVNYIFAPEAREAALERMASPECRIVSLTITEGGYYLNQATGIFNDQHPDIVHDLRQPGEPSCSFGYMAEALDRRRRRGLPPFTIMSCDNLQQNGSVAKRMMLAFAGLRDPKLARWLEFNGAFPNSMVDRITPITTNVHRAELRSQFGLDDSWPVVTEPFRQWVIEDQFPGGRPPWEDAGAQLTSDVLPYEKIKIRLLNAGHQALCHIGRLLGYAFVHDAVADPKIARLLQRFMDEEVTPLLPEVPGIELRNYRRTLLERFANPAIGDSLSRIATDASERIPKFVLPSIEEQLARGGRIRLLSFTVACWFRTLAGTDGSGRKLPVVDSLSEILQARALEGGPDPRPLLSIRSLFGKGLADSALFFAEVDAALGQLYAIGPRATLEKQLQSD